MSELDEYARIIRRVAEEAYSDPELVKTAPHNSTIHKVRHDPLDDPDQWAITWRAYRKKAAAREG
jgi:glycine dehydrogenase subunit 2